MLLTLSFLRSVKRGIIRGVLPSRNAGAVLTSHPYHFVSVIRGRLYHQHQQLLAGPSFITDYVQQNPLIPGNSLLYPPMVVEELGSWQSVGLKNGFKPGDHIRCREETEEETSHRLPVLQPQTPQLLGLQIFLL